MHGKVFRSSRWEWLSDHLVLFLYLVFSMIQGEIRWTTKFT